jgi:nucleotide-binding universal stress UspA family protein
MTPVAVVSYDGTSNDDDALELARLFGEAGAELVLAYVRHSTLADAGRERLEEVEAEALLERGSAALDGIRTRREVILHASTAEGLKELATNVEADLIVFGSEYRTAAGRVSPQRSTQALLDDGPTAIAIAPAGYRTQDVGTIGLLAGLDDHAAIDTAHALANHFDARVTGTAHDVDLLIVGSRAEAPEGRTIISAQIQNAIEGAGAPVLVVARGVALTFRQPLYVA